MTPAQLLHLQERVENYLQFEDVQLDDKHLKAIAVIVSAWILEGKPA